jgi:hypothetical protein
MEKSRDGISRVFCVLELELVLTGVREGIHVLVSRVGHDDMLDKQWPCTHGVLNSNQLEDLVAYIDDLVREVVIGFAGVQEKLPME